MFWNYFKRKFNQNRFHLTCHRWQDNCITIRNHKMKKDLTIRDSQNTPTLSVVGDTYRIIISGDDTGGAYAVIDMLVPPGGGPPPHAHAGFQEAFYIMEGEIEVRTETQKYTATKGMFVNIPLGGRIHQFKNVSSSPTHLLCIITPAGMEKMFEEMAAAGPGLKEKIKSLSEKYGQELYPPDYLEKKAFTPNSIKDPQDWITGDETMTEAQRSYLHTLAAEAGVPPPEDLTKAQASEKIDELQHKTGRGLTK